MAPPRIATCLFFLAALAFNATAQFDIANDAIEKTILEGRIDSAHETLKALVNMPNSNPLARSKYFTHLGQIEKIKGDMDRALYYWKQSNAARLEVYQEGDYHVAWNYALLSNYHYEKTHRGLAKAYADSCVVLLEGLTTEEQKEIEVYRIWDLLAQSYKLHRPLGTYDFAPWDSAYVQVRELYENSVAFQLKHQTPQHHLAKTYHLLANSYHDLATRGFRTPGFEPQGKACFDKANTYYDRALDLWQKLYGPVHYQKALSHLVQAIMYEVASLEYIGDKYTEAEKHFELALRAFGVDIRNSSEAALKSVPNKSDLLMCLKIYAEMYLNMPVEMRPTGYLDKMTILNQLAIELWEIMHAEFQSSNTNQQLAIYHLVPFKLTYLIELERLRNGEAYSIEKMFTSSQRLKFYDLQQMKTGTGMTKPKSIAKIQGDLNRGEYLVDYFTYDPIAACAIVLTHDTAYATPLSIEFEYPNGAIDLRTAIVDFDMAAYTNLAHSWYKTVLRPLNVQQAEKLIICPHAHLNDVPFDALLVSIEDRPISDYRQFDYLIRHHEIQYVASPIDFIGGADMLTFSVSVIAPLVPDDSTFSDLPFSRKLAHDITQKGYGWAAMDRTIPTDSLFETKASILHLSTHGVIDTYGSEYSQLVLGESRLKLEEVYAHESLAKLVVLNACNTSRGVLYEDDGIHGFVRAYFAAGAQAVLSNLWEVDDQSSNALLKTFYNNLSGGQSTTTALRNAQLDVIDHATSSDLAAPYYWSGPKLVGREMVFSSGDSDDHDFVWKGAIAGVFLLLVGGTWVWSRRKS